MVAMIIAKWRNNIMATTICLWITLMAIIAFVYFSVWTIEWRDEMEDKLEAKHMENEELRRFLRIVEKGER